MSFTTWKWAFLLFGFLSAGCSTTDIRDSSVSNCSKAIAATSDKDWFRSDDLPTDWIYRNKTKFQGQGSYRLELSQIGNVTNCTIFATSGFKVIDDSVCANFKRRASFNSVPNSCEINDRSVIYIVMMKWDVNSKQKPAISVRELY